VSEGYITGSRSRYFFTERTIISKVQRGGPRIERELRDSAATAESASHSGRLKFKVPEDAEFATLRLEQFRASNLIHDRNSVAGTQRLLEPNALFEKQVLKNKHACVRVCVCARSILFKNETNRPRETRAYFLARTFPMRLGGEQERGKWGGDGGGPIDF